MGSAMRLRAEWAAFGIAFGILACVALIPSVAAAVSVRELVELSQVDGLGVSPDGQSIAFQVRMADATRNRYVSSWYVIGPGGRRLRRVADAGEPLMPAIQNQIIGNVVTPLPQWSSDGKALRFIRREAGTNQVWQADLDRGELRQIAFGPVDAFRFAHAADGQKLYVEFEPTADQRKVSLEEEGKQGFLFDRRYYPAFATHPLKPEDSRRYTSVADSATDSEIRSRELSVVDLAGGGRRPASLAERDEFRRLTTPPRLDSRPNVHGAAVRSSAGAFAWLEARDPLRQGVYPPLTIMATTGELNEVIECPAAECRGQVIRGLWWFGANLVFARGEGVAFGETALYSWKPGSSEVRPILRTAGKLVAGEHEWTCAPADSALVCLFEEPDRPGRVVRVNVNSGSIETLFDPNPDFSHADSERPEPVTISTPGRVETFGYLVLPKERKSGRRLPLVIVTYRCAGFLKGGTGDEYPIFAFASHGFAVLCLDLPITDYERGSYEALDAYSKWSRGPGDPIKQRIQRTLDEAVAELARRGIIDPGRVGLTGLSYGADTVGFALFNMRHLTAAAASSTGIGPSHYFLTSAASREYMHEWGLSSPRDPRWQQLSLAWNVDKVRAPFLVNAADREMLLSVDEVTALERVGRAVEMYVFPDEYHVKWQPAHRLAIYERNIDWMSFWLRGEEDPAGSKRSQYARWRALRERHCASITDARPWFCGA